MENSSFIIDINKESGTVDSIVIKNDPYNMNWCREGMGWGNIVNINQLNEHESVGMRFEGVGEEDGVLSSTYSNGKLRVVVKRFFDENGLFTENFTVKNLRKSDLFLEYGELGIVLPFNDVYTYADECMVGHCNTHIWCGHNTSYVYALKMGESDYNLGLVVTKGALDSYSQNNTKSNDRGIFVVNCGHLELSEGEKYVLEWKIFIHSGSEDFFGKASRFPQYIGIDALHYTVFEDENIKATVTLPEGAEKLSITFDNKPVEYTLSGRKASICFKPDKTGEGRLTVKADGSETFAEFFVSEKLTTVIKKRIDFIIDKQQYIKEGKQLDGTFLIYDTKEKEYVFDSVVTDHNACRERIGMAILIARYLRDHKDARIEAALDKYIVFLKREFYDEASGRVYDSAGKDPTRLRLYNAPWMVTLFTELYYLKKDNYYLENIVRMLDNYYDNGGYNFYPNGFSMYRTVKVFEYAGMEDKAATITEQFKKHTDNILSKGLSYPKHEVNYEQTIVTPAVTFISEMGRLLGEDKYLTQAGVHVRVLERFDGVQPSFHLKQISIRYWDDFWFGKNRLFGDTLPHYWSCLSARSYNDYFLLSDDADYLKKADECFRNCLCLFNENGEGSCAYIYPFKLNNTRGRFYDEWANDQDFALYFAYDSEIFNN